MTKTNIIVKLQVDGVHQWPGVTKDHSLFSVFFLKYPHRHMFHIVAKKEVSHSDRDIEIINLKRNIEKYLQEHYYNAELKTHEFKDMSCEMIANMLVKVHGLSYCEVLEDGENGAEVMVTRNIIQIPITDQYSIQQALKDFEKSNPQTSTTAEQLKINYETK